MRKNNHVKNHVYVVTAVACIAILILLSYTNIGLPSVGQAVTVGKVSDKGVDMSTCTDSDGADYYVVGKTTGYTKKTKSPISVVDYCETEQQTLVEYTCENNYIATAKIDCHCSNGVCLQSMKNKQNKAVPEVTITAKKSATIKTSDCSDSDGGIDYYSYGTLTMTDYSTETSQSWEDSCYSNGLTLAEWYCDEDDEKQQVIYNCPNGCSGGACT